jgi:hypothetical protein
MLESDSYIVKHLIHLSLLCFWCDVTIHLAHKLSLNRLVLKKILCCLVFKATLRLFIGSNLGKCLKLTQVGLRGGI